MFTTLLIYFSALALCIVAGIAVVALVAPARRWLHPGTTALGAAAIIAVAYPLGFVLKASIVAFLVCAAIVASLVRGVLHLRGRGGLFRAQLADAMAVSWGEGLALALGAALGVLFLIPVLSLGFPTTIASGIADGWARSVLSEWIGSHALIDSSPHVGLDRPIGTYSGQPPSLGAGFEYIVAIVMTLLRRWAYETVLPVAALAAPIAVSGWAQLLATVTQRRVAAWQSAIVAIAATAPMFVMPLVDNYLTQLFSLALWPVAMAASLAFFRERTVANAVLAAIALGAVAGTYPQVLPWVGPPVILLALAAAEVAGRDGRPFAAARLRNAGTATVALLLLGLAVVTVSPFELARAYDSVVVFSENVTSNSAFPLMQVEQDLGVVLGAISQFSVPPFSASPVTSQLLPGIALMLAVAVVGFAALAGAARRVQLPLLALGIGVGVVTLAAYVKYKHGDAYGYGTYKTLLFGGTLLAGLLVVVLAAREGRGQAARMAAAGVCLAVWLPVSATLLQRQHDGAQGFRAADRALIRELDRLPPRATVLVEGAAENEYSFRMRMTAGYFAAARERNIDGLGSTQSYFTGGGAAGWRPSRPWDYVVASDSPSVFPLRRDTVWHDAPFRLQEAPPVDVTPYAVSPSARIGTPATGKRFWLSAPAGARDPVDYVAGPVELVVSNRQVKPASVRLDLELTGMTRGRALRMGTEGGTVDQVRVPKGQTRTARYTVELPPRSTQVVSLDPGAPEVKADGSLAPLFALSSVRLEPWGSRGA